MKNRPLGIIAGAALALTPQLQAELDTPGAGVDYNALIGGDDNQAWSFWVRTYVGYNDNVQLLPNFPFSSTDQSSGYWGVTSQGAYEFWDGGDFSAGVAFRYDQTLHFESSGSAPADSYDLTVIEPALYLNYESGDWYGRLTYSYRWEDAKTRLIGVSSHNVGLKIGYHVNDCLDLEIGASHGWDEFHTRGFGVFDRDSTRERYSLSLIHQAYENGTRYIVSYSLLENDADGLFYRYDGHEVAARMEKPLTASLGLVAQVTYTDLDYETGLIPDREYLSAGVQLIYIIDENWSADIYYNYLDIDSDVAFFEDDRNNVGIGLRYDF